MLRGSCMCGTVRYRIDGPVFRMTHCHCSMCRKGHGAAYATYLNAKRTDLSVEHGADAIGRYASSSGVERAFCSRCGSTLTWAADADDRIGIAAGTLDDDPGLRPELHLWVGSKAPWHEMADDGLPRFGTDDGV